jgi:WD40 repeat protein
MHTLVGHVAALFVAMAVTVASGGRGLSQQPKLRTTFRGTAAEVRSLVFSPDRKTLASTSESSTLPHSGEIMLWNLTAGKGSVLLERPTHSDWLISFSPDGTLATGGPDGIRLWNPTTRKQKRTLKGQKISCLAFSPDGKILAAGGMKEMALGKDAVLRTDQVKLWDVESGKRKADLEEGQLGGVGAVAFSPDGKLLASAVLSFAPRLVVWDVASGKKKWIRRGKKVITCLAFRPGGKMLATGDEDGTIKLWDITMGEVNTTLIGHTRWVTAVAFTPDGQTLASGSRDTTVRLWDVETGKTKATIRGHEKKVESVAISPTGRILASGGEDRTIKLWDLPAKDR